MNVSELSLQRIKIIDDSETSIDLLLDALDGDYDVSVALNGENGLEDIREEVPDLILLDIMMPGIDGYEVCRRLLENPLTRDVPVIFLTANDDLQSKTRGFRLGAVDYITKPFDMVEVQARVKTHLALKCARQELAEQNDLLEKKVQERTKELLLTQEVTILSMASLVEARDWETGGHIIRTQRYVKLLANALQDHPKFATLLVPEHIELICKSAPLHDIGKVGVPDCILQKPGPLTVEEYEKMKLHTLYGYNAIVNAEKKLGSSSFLRFAREITYTHHEYWDGTGYPRGLAEDDIPIAGRLMALADMYDALISRRVYKDAVSHEDVLPIIHEARGTQLDPDIVDAFFQIQDQFKTTAKALNDNDMHIVGGVS